MLQKHCVLPSRKENIGSGAAVSLEIYSPGGDEGAVAATRALDARPKQWSYSRGRWRCPKGPRGTRTLPRSCMKNATSNALLLFLVYGIGLKYVKNDQQKQRVA